MSRVRKHIAVIALCLLPAVAFSQNNKKESIFSAGLLAGLNMAQIDGDGVAGYNKVGLNLGGVAFIRLHQNWKLGFEILYSQKGSRTKITQWRNPNESFKIILDYLEVPVMLYFTDGTKAMFGAGFSYGNLIREKSFVGGYETPNPYVGSFFNEDFNGIVAVTFLFGQHWGVNLRGAYSIATIGVSNTRGSGNRAVFSNYLSARLMYTF